MPSPRKLVSAAGLLILALLTISGLACDKVPLLAPTGTVINLTITSEFMALNSSIDVIAVLIENGAQGGTGTATTSTTGAGTPVQNGTVVSFTTTIGRIEPAEARTENSRVTVKLITAGESGKATITAYSGGAKSTGTVLIGAAAVKLVTTTASPQNLPSNGGTSTVSARVEDTNGNGLVGVPVLFTTTKGSFSASTVNSNSAGVATTTLATTAKAEVTAAVGAVTGKVTIDVATRASVTVAGPSSTTAVSSPATFTVTVGTAQPVNSISINFGDGSSRSLGTSSTSVTHFYSSPGIFDVTVSAVDVDGVTSSSTIQVAITALEATGSASPNTAKFGTSVLFTAVVTPGSPSIDRYEWDFGDGTPAFPTNGKSQGHVFALRPNETSSTYTVTITVVPSYGSRLTIYVPITITSF